MRLDIRYRARFGYTGAVRESQNELRACPLSDQRQQLISYRVSTSPASRVFSFTDYWGTRVDTFGVREPHRHLEVVAEAVVETRYTQLVTSAPRVEAVRDPAFADEHVEYLERTPHADWGPEVLAEAKAQADLVGPDLVGLVLAIHRRVGSSMRYAPGATYVGVDVEEVLERREGVCQDFAHLAIAMCRSLGIPARYVSGYLFTTNDALGADPEGDVVEVQTHAWFEAALPGVGWIALDPTNQQEVGLRHVKIGHGRDYDDVPPLQGVFSGPAAHGLEVNVEIRRVGSPQGSLASSPAARPRPTPPEPPLRRSRLPYGAQQQQQQQ